MTQDGFEKVTYAALIAFATSVGVLTLAGLLLILGRLAAETATALAAAGPAGIGITISLRKGK